MTGQALPEAVAARPHEDAGADWPAFLDAVHGMTTASCCGGGAAGSHMARGRTADAPLLGLGLDAWRQGIARRAPLVPAIDGAFILPAVTLLDPGRPPAGPVDLRVEAGRIAAILPPGSDHGDTRILRQLRGQFVTTALADMHVHMPPENLLGLTPLFLLLTLRHGVVRVRDAGDPDGSATPAALALVQSGALPGPQLHYAYAFVGAGRARWANSLDMAHPEDAPRIVEALRRAGASWIKAYENLDVPRIAALVRAADAAGLQLMGHVPTPLRLEDAGLPDAQHGFGVPEPATLRRDHVLNRAIDWDSVDEARIDAVVSACRTRGLAMTPTLVTTMGLLRMEQWHRERAAPDMRLIPSFYPAIVWHPRHGLPVYRDIPPEDFARARDALARKQALVRAALAAGVDVRLGTDTQQPFVVPGAALHAELRAFEDAGAGREAAWRMAGPKAARTLGITDADGLAVGQRADLIVSPASPFADDWSADRISATVCGGTCLFAADLDQAIARELARFEGRFSRHVTHWLARFAVTRAARDFVA